MNRKPDWKSLVRAVDADARRLRVSPEERLRLRRDLRRAFEEFPPGADFQVHIFSKGEGHVKVLFGDVPPELVPQGPCAADAANDDAVH